MGAVEHTCVYFGVRLGCGKGGWVQVSNYVCMMSHRSWSGGSAVCAVEVWVDDCGGGVENIFLLA